jgi:hypothetical protein
MSAPDLAATMRGLVVRLHVWPQIAPGGFVAVARTHDDASPGVLLDGVPSAHCLLTHDPEVTRPDAKGRALMAEVLTRGGTALLKFESTGDAIAAASWCRAMAEGGAA